VLLNLERDKVKRLQEQLDEEKTNNERLIAMVHSMNKDYQAYQLIKEFERKRRELQQKNIDMYRYNPELDEFHQLRIKRNMLAHAISS
jgi:hypothetical protein